MYPATESETKVKPFRFNSLIPGLAFVSDPPVLGAKRLMECFQSWVRAPDQGLEMLNVGNTGLSAAGIEHLCSGLQCMSSLLALELENCHMDYNGEQVRRNKRSEIVWPYVAYWKVLIIVTKLFVG